MLKDFFTKIPYLILLPKKFFKETVSGKEFTTQNLIVTGAILIPLITVLHFFESDLLVKYGDTTKRIIYLAGFITGMALSFAFRTYLISLILNRSGFEIKFQQVGMVIGLSMIVYLIMYSIPIILGTHHFNKQIEIVMHVWNLLLIFIGIRTLTRISVYRGIVLIVIMFSIELFIRYAIFGNLI
jgi:hypothetical protein